MGTLASETRQAVRTLIRDPGVTTTAVFVLALAVGGNAAMFGIVDALLLKPLPRGSATGVLVGVYSRDSTRPDAFRSFSYPNYTDLRVRRDLFSELVAQRFTLLTLTENNSTRRTAAAIVSSNFFSALGAPITLGRGFSAAEERPRAAIAVAVVSHTYLGRRGLEPRETLGDTILVDGKPFTVVGVAPRGFTGTTAVMSPEVWLPVGVYHDLASQGENQPANPREQRDPTCSCWPGCWRPVSRFPRRRRRSPPSRGRWKRRTPPRTRTRRCSSRRCHACPSARGPRTTHSSPSSACCC